MKPTARWMFVLVALCLPQVVQGAMWRATAGAQSNDKGMQALAFLPNEMWIHAGDSISWTFPSDEIHTVTFLKSGQLRLPFSVGCPGYGGTSFDGSTCLTTPPMLAGQTYTVSFPATGNFKLVCLVHENMTATVHVFPLSASLPHDQDFYNQQAERERSNLLSNNCHDQQNGEGESEANAVTVGTGQIVATGGGSQSMSVMRFMNDKAVIHVGETIEWTNDDPVTPHTITFGPDPTNPIPPSANVTMDADGARHATIGSTSDVVHSGFIVSAPQERIGLAQAPLGVTRFRVKFTHAGVFPYKCALHDDLGMIGTVTVRP
jgi:plastocyanin